MEDIAEGRPVVSLSGGSSRSTRFNLGRLISNRFSSFMDRTRRSDGRQRADSGTGSAGLGDSSHASSLGESQGSGDGDDGGKRLFGLIGRKCLVVQRQGQWLLIHYTIKKKIMVCRVVGEQGQLMVRQNALNIRSWADVFGLESGVTTEG